MDTVTKMIVVKRAFLALSLSFLFCLPAQAQNTVTITDTAVVRTPIYNCKTDFSQHCKGVPDKGNDRLNCLMAHEKDLEHACRASVMAAMQQNKTTAMSLNYAYDSCQSERLSLCSDIAAGDGRLIDCFKAHESSIGEVCMRTLKNTGLWDSQPGAVDGSTTTLSTDKQ